MIGSGSPFYFHYLAGRLKTARFRPAEGDNLD
jgi:hypothetical protein